MTDGVVAKPGMATGSSGLCVPVLQMMSNGSAEMSFPASAGEGIG